MESDYKRTVHDNAHKDETPDVSDISNPDVAHEINDVNVFAIIKFSVGLVVATGFVFALMAAMLALFEKLEQRNDAPQSVFERRAFENNIPLQAAANHTFTPEQLANDPDIAKEMTGAQTDFRMDAPTTEWRTIREIRQKELTSYGRIKNNPEEFHIPVDEAKRRLLQSDQLPVRGENPQQNSADGFDLVPTMESAGRRVERRKQ